MKISLSIRSKLFIAIFLACAVVVSSAAALFHYRTQKTFAHYIHTLDETFIKNSVSVLEQHYARHNNWKKLRNRRTWRRLLFSGNHQRPRHPPEARMRLERHSQSGRQIASRVVLLDNNQRYVEGKRHKTLPQLLTPLYSGKDIVGYLGMYKRRSFNDDSEDSRFIGEQRKTLLLVALLTPLISFLIAFLLSRQLVKPIQSLRRSSSELARGNYATRIEVQNNDELGLLSKDFNQLAQSLQQHEQSRQQWIMDIAHELRTPISILRGEIEAIQDGINSADTATIQSLHQETLHLQRLVEDLYTLSMSDNGSLSYRKGMLDINESLQETLAQLGNQLKDHELSLYTDLPRHAIETRGDKQRLQQLFQNLLKNNLRYTHSPGELYISLAQDKKQIVIKIEDSAPGVPDDALPHLFERLYRVENSRNRATGGAGIGLSICHNIVQAHNGTISAEHSEYGGLCISIVLPQTTE